MKKIISVLIVLTSLLAAFLYLDNKNFKEPKKENNKLNSNEVMAVYQKDTGDYYSVDTIPSSGYELNTTESYCMLNNERKSVSIELKDDGVYFGKLLDKGTKCYLYFDKLKGKTMDEILAGYSVVTRPDFGNEVVREFSKQVSLSSDGLGDSKYFMGAALDNYVKFGGFYWRIIRMNGDKTTRLIYAGKASVIDALSNKQTVLANGYNDSSTQYTNAFSSVFNTENNDNAYVGLKYKIGSLRGSESKSTILTKLDEWYEANLKTSYGKYIDGSTGFCGERSPSSSMTSVDGNGGTGTTTTYYAGYIRIYRGPSGAGKTPSYRCSNKEDLYTVKGSTKGNAVLDNPIGLISADEVVFAGGDYFATNKNYYLYSGNYYWTMTPSGFSSGAAGVLYSRTGVLDYNVGYSSGVRPVINLKADLEYIGTGTWNDPFIPILT